MAKTRVYIIRDYSGRRKIGIARNVAHRLSNLQVGNADPLVIEYSFAFKSGFAARQIEKLVHSALKVMQRHAAGEWFTVEPLFARRVIVEAASQLRYRFQVEIEQPESDSGMAKSDLDEVLSRLYGGNEKTCIICDKRAEYRYSGEQHGEGIREQQRWLCEEHYRPYSNDQEWHHLPDQIVPEEDRPHVPTPIRIAALR